MPSFLSLFFEAHHQTGASIGLWSQAFEVGVTITFISRSPYGAIKVFEGYAQPEHHSNVEVLYRQIYFETIDTVANCSVEHFNQCMQTVGWFF